MRIRNFLAMFMTMITACSSFGIGVKASGSEKSAEDEMKKAIESTESLDESTQKDLDELRNSVNYDVLRPLLKLLMYKIGSISRSGLVISEAAERMANDIMANYKLDSIELDSEKQFITEVVFKAAGRPSIIFSCKRFGSRPDYYAFDMVFGGCEKTLHEMLSTDANIKIMLPTPDFEMGSWSSGDRAAIDRTRRLCDDNLSCVGKFYHQHMFQVAVRNNLAVVCGKIRTLRDDITKLNCSYNHDLRFAYSVDAAFEMVSKICFGKVKNIKRKFDLWLLAEISEKLYAMLSDPSVAPFFAHASLGDTISYFAENLARYMCDQVKNQYISGNLHVE